MKRLLRGRRLEIEIFPIPPSVVCYFLTLIYPCLSGAIQPKPSNFLLPFSADRIFGICPHYDESQFLPQSHKFSKPGSFSSGKEIIFPSSSSPTGLSLSSTKTLKGKGVVKSSAKRKSTLEGHLKDFKDRKSEERRIRLIKYECRLRTLDLEIAKVHLQKEVLKSQVFPAQPYPSLPPFRFSSSFTPLSSPSPIFKTPPTFLTSFVYPIHSTNYSPIYDTPVSTAHAPYPITTSPPPSIPISSPLPMNTSPQEKYFPLTSSVKTIARQ